MLAEERTGWGGAGEREREDGEEDLSPPATWTSDLRRQLRAPPLALLNLGRGAARI